MLRILFSSDLRCAVFRPPTHKHRAVAGIFCYTSTRSTVNRPLKLEFKRKRACETVNAWEQRRIIYVHVVKPIHRSTSQVLRQETQLNQRRNWHKAFEWRIDSNRRDDKRSSLRSHP